MLPHNLLLLTFSLAAAAHATDAPLLHTSPRQMERASLLPALEVASLPAFPGGAVAEFRIRTEGAAAQQLQFHNFGLAPEATLTLHGIKDGQIVSTFGPYTGIGESLDGGFLTRVVPGEELLVRLENQPGNEWPFEIAGVIPFDSKALADMRERNDASLLPHVDARPRALETRFSSYRGRIIQHVIQDGRAFVEGDIELSAKDLEPAMASMSKQPERAGLGYDYGRWPNGIMPYEIDPSTPNMSAVATAIFHWNGHLAKHLILRPRMPGESNYVRFTAGTSNCTSSLGMIGGVQHIRLTSDCSMGNVVHEIGHAAGLQHEQKREDRDRYALIAYWNIQTDYVSQFTKADTWSNTDYSLYDYGSIMHYGPKAFSSNGLDTIIPITTGDFKKIRGLMGQRDSLSLFDLATLMTMYPQVR